LEASKYARSTRRTSTGTSITGWAAATRRSSSATPARPFPIPSSTRRRQVE
jgi:hypothetical protein